MSNKFKVLDSGLSINKISKTYGNKQVVRDISISIKRKEVVGLLGPNGAGKSTLFNIAIGAEKADGGEVFVSGKNITNTPIHLRSKLGLGYLPQTRSLFDDLTTYTNLHGLVQLHEKNEKKAKEKTETLLERFNLVHLRSLKARVLSGGESKRLLLARLMISNPKVVLVDEIFQAVDPIIIQEMQKYIIQIQSQGVSCILTDHSVNTLFETTDRNYLIDSGQILAQGTKRELLKNSEAIKRYFGTNFHQF